MSLRAFLKRADVAVQDTKQSVTTTAVVAGAALLVAVVAIVIVLVKALWDQQRWPTRWLCTAGSIPRRCSARRSSWSGFAWPTSLARSRCTTGPWILSATRSVKHRRHSVASKWDYLMVPMDELADRGAEGWRVIPVPPSQEVTVVLGQPKPGPLMFLMERGLGATQAHAVPTHQLLDAGRY